MGSKTKPYHYYFINNVFSSLIGGFGEFFKLELFPRSTELVISTYSKSVMHYRNRVSEDYNERHHPKYPFLTLDPGLDVEPKEVFGELQGNYPSFDVKYGAFGNYGPNLYEDENIVIAPVLNRYKGSLSLICWCSSIYEYMDYRILTYQFFGGVGRPIYPKVMRGYYVMPEELIYYTYDNPYTGVSYNIDWNNDTLVGGMMVKNINKNKFVYPFEIRPWLTLTGCSDGVEKYGSDDLSEHRLTIDMEWECSLPTHLIFHVKTEPAGINRTIFSIDTGFNYIKVDDYLDRKFPDYRMMSIVDNVTGKTISKDLTFDFAYDYNIDDRDIVKIENNENVTIRIPDLNVSTDEYWKFQVIGKYGELLNGYHWKISEPDTIELVSLNFDVFVEGDIVIVLVYKED